MPGTADFHEPIADARLSQPAGVMDYAAALDAAVDVLDAPIRLFLRACEGSSSRCLGRHDDLDLRQRERQAAEILTQATPCGPGVRGGIGNPRIGDTAGVRLPETETRECRVDPPHVFHRVALFRATLTARLLRRIWAACAADQRPSLVGQQRSCDTVGSGSVGPSASACQCCLDRFARWPGSPNADRTLTWDP
jgi:hypothetical protein